jgi:hypothetical protein
MGARGRIRSVEEFGVAQVVAATLETYRNVLHAGLTAALCV